MYPAMRDAKAAVRWVRANAEHYNLNPEHITAIGGSAGACSVVGLATTFEDDYKNVRSPWHSFSRQFELSRWLAMDCLQQNRTWQLAESESIASVNILAQELTVAEDPTLSTTNLEQSSSIATGLVQWGGEYVPLYTTLRDPAHRTRYTRANAPLSTCEWAALEAALTRFRCLLLPFVHCLGWLLIVFCASRRPRLRRRSDLDCRGGKSLRDESGCTEIMAKVEEMR